MMIRIPLWKLSEIIRSSGREIYEKVHIDTEYEEEKTMSRILVSGLANIEVTCRVEEFPIKYQPIDYNFFGVNLAVAGVGYNLVKSFATLGDDVDFATYVGEDMAAKLVLAELSEATGDTLFRRELTQTPASVVLYDKTGARRIYCDLKDIQDKSYDFSKVDVCSYDIVAACNINFSRPLLHTAKAAGVPIATDVHVFSDIDDAYNQEFLQYADIVFLSNENIVGQEKNFVEKIAGRFDTGIIVVGRGSAGALMYVRDENRFYDMPAAKPERIVNTVGAGDCLFSTFVSMYAKKNMSPQQCLTLAQQAAAYKIGFDGAAVGFRSFDVENLIFHKSE